MQSSSTSRSFGRAERGHPHRPLRLLMHIRFVEVLLCVVEEARRLLAPEVRLERGFEEKDARSHLGEVRGDLRCRATELSVVERREAHAGDLRAAQDDGERATQATDERFRFRDGVVLGGRGARCVSARFGLRRERGLEGDDARWRARSFSPPAIRTPRARSRDLFRAAMGWAGSSRPSRERYSSSPCGSTTPKFGWSPGRSQPSARAPPASCASRAHRSAPPPFPAGSEPKRHSRFCDSRTPPKVFP